MIALVVLGLWTAPRASKGRVAAGQSRRQRSRRAVVLSDGCGGLAVGMLVMGLWLWQTGLPWWAVVLFLGAAFAIFLALTRVIVEAGLSSAVEGLSARALWSRALARRHWGRRG